MFKKIFLLILLSIVLEKGYVNEVMARALSIQPQSLVVFSGRKEPLIKPIIALFEKTTGIKVVLRTGQSALLAQQILHNISHPTADIFIAKESGSLEYLRLNNAFVPYVSEGTQRIPKELKANDNTWIGVSGRSRALMYNKTMVKEEDLPQYLEDLTDERFKGKIAVVNNGNPSFVAWISALRIRLGDTKVKELLMKFKHNDMQRIGNSHTQIRKAVGRGEYPYGLVNHYYYHLQKHEIDKAYSHVGIVYLDQEQGGRGEIVNVSGVGIIRNTNNIYGAKKFIDFLTSNEAQSLFANINFEYPLVEGVKANDEVLMALNCESGRNALECIHRMPVSLDQLGELLMSTLDLLDEISWN